MEMGIGFHSHFSVGRISDMVDGKPLIRTHGMLTF